VNPILGIVIIALLVGVAYFIVTTTLDYFQGRKNSRGVDNSELKAELLHLRQKYSIAIAAHRANANGAGNPILESIDALDKIEQLEIKELS
jgi:hypothetical protein